MPNEAIPTLEAGTLDTRMREAFGEDLPPPPDIAEPEPAED